ncbi:MAG TPA: anti-sigma factor [Polyangiaceae bacterium]|jgi:anti-sigma-K factor RskA|nr:anti-sigma factor [Polyangiaceae bacterium]
MNPRAIELLCDRALDGLDPAEHAELAQLIAYDDVSYELAATAIDLSHGLHVREPLPEHLAQRIEMQALQMRAPARPVTPIKQKQKRSVFPWLAAAACFAIAVAALIWSGRPRPTALAPLPPAPEIELPKPTLAQQRKELLAAGAKPKTWTATTDSAALKASGDVVWDNDKQRGFMRFRGLAKNNPRESQYQLWIFDGARDDRYPVDGGVFDIDKETGDVIIAIDPKIRVREPTLFAVTVEKPGGVVVSNRERIVVTAKLSG